MLLGTLGYEKSNRKLLNLPGSPGLSTRALAKAKKK
jgi:hypothetical protein